MKLKILGTKEEIKESLPRHARYSGVLIDDELLLDFGVLIGHDGQLVKI
jgi:hypothetical protein